MSLAQQLQNLGWNMKEAQIYVALLKLGMASAADIAQKAKLKRTTVYNFLPDLIQKGFVKRTQKNRKTLFYVDDTKNLLKPLEEQKEKWGSLIEELEKIHNVLPDRPQIRFFEGEAGVVQFFQETLERTPAGQFIYEFIGPKAFYEKLPSHFASSYVPERIRRKIPIRILASKSRTAEALAQTAAKELRQIKLIDSFTFDGAIVIYGNNVGLLSLSTTFMGVVIENEAIATIQRAGFELLWNNL